LVVHSLQSPNTSSVQAIPPSERGKLAQSTLPSQLAKHPLQRSQMHLPSTQVRPRLAHFPFVFLSHSFFFLASVRSATRPTPPEGHRTASDAAQQRAPARAGADGARPRIKPRSIHA
jgi:hypothetical protein